MSLSSLSYKLTDFLSSLEQVGLKLNPDQLSQETKDELDKFDFSNFIIMDKKADGTPLPNNALLKVVCLVTYESEVKINLLKRLVTITAGIDGAEEPSFVVEVDVFGDRADLSITAMATVTADFTNFPTAGNPFFKRMIFTSGTLQDLLDGKAVELTLPETDAEKELKVELANFESTITLNSSLEFGIKNAANVLKLSTSAPCQIGNTGFIVYFENLGFEGKFPDFGLTVETASIVPPSRFRLPGGIPLPRILISDGKINGDGLSGKFSALWDLQFDASKVSTNPFSYKVGANSPAATFFSAGDKALKGGFKKIEFVFENSRLVSSDVCGQLLISYFDIPLDFRLDFRSAEDFDVVLTSLTPKGLELVKKHLLRLNITKFGISRRDDVGEIVLSGGLEPLLFASEGMVWPKFDVKDLKINTEGKISIGEAWIDLKDLATFDLFGFHFELRKVGIGSENDTHLWVDLSGGLRLIEQIPMGVDVEGFRIKWPIDLKLPPEFSVSELKTFTSKLGIEFKGVQLTHAVPGVMKLDGMIRFFKDPSKVGFAGDMILDLPAAGFKAEAGLMVGLNSGNIAGDPDASPFPFFYVYFGFEAAAGIPLGQSGLALKGALGMFGINVSPDKTPDQNWYYDWYKRGPYVGAHPTNKWKDERNAFAIGVGVTITTADGFVKGTRGLLVLAIPGPILIIEGRALVLEGLKPADSAEPPLRALAVFDGKEKIAQFNIEAQLELVEDVVEAYAMLEAFFDFKDLTNWHLYLGQKEPLDRRIRANVLNILKADSYLMLDMLDSDSLRARMGASVNIVPEIPDLAIQLTDTISVGIKFDAHMEIAADGEISLQPEQFKSKATLDAALDISALGFTFSITAYAELSIDGPSPLQIEAEVGYKLDFPSPIPDFEDRLKFKFEGPDVNISVNSPLSQVSLFNRFSDESKSTAVLTATAPNLIVPDGVAELSAGEQALAMNAPVVYPDSQPVLSFEHDMNIQGGGFLMNPNGNGFKQYNVGRLAFLPSLTKIEIFERKKSALWTDPWNLIHSSTAVDDKKLVGAWLADGDSLSPNVMSSRRLQLMTTNALINTAKAVAHNGCFFNQDGPVPVILASAVKANNPEMFKCPADPTPLTVVDFSQEETLTIKAGQLFNYSGLVIVSDDGLKIDAKSSCLSSFSDTIRIRFDKPVLEVEFLFCSKMDKPKVVCHRFQSGDEITALILKSKMQKKRLPDIKCNIPVDVVVTKSDFIKLKIKVKNAKDSFSCLLMKNGPGISEIRIRYRENADKDAANNLTCINNGLIPPVLPDQHIFKPGCFYKIVTNTTLAGTIDTDSLNQVPEELRSTLAFLYDGLLEAKGLRQKAFSNISYYQTNTPPVNLERYVKWSYPYRQQTNFYGDHKMVLRFNRNYINKLFGNEQGSPKHVIKFRIRDFNGRHFLVPPGNVQWSSANSSTLFPDEEVMNTIIPSTAGAKKDSLVIITKPAGFEFVPNQRYELIIHHDDIGPSLLIGKNDLERNWQLPSSGPWSFVKVNETAVGIQRSALAGATFLITGKDDWSNVAINADVNFPDRSSVGFIFRRMELKGSQLVSAFYLVKFTRINGQKVSCAIEFHVVSGNSVAQVKTIQPATEINVNPSNGLVRLSAHILGNTIKAGTLEAMPVVITEDMLLNFHRINFGPLPSTDVNATFKSPLTSGTSGLFAPKGAMVQFRNIQINQSDLLTIPFTTGAAGSAKSLFTMTPPETGAMVVSVHAQNSPSWKPMAKGIVNEKMQSFLNSEMNLHKMGVDLSYGNCTFTDGNLVLTSQEAFEKAKSLFLKSRKELDEQFNTMMLEMNRETLFLPIPKAKVETRIILSASKQVEGIVLHSPQSLDLQQSITGTGSLFARRGRLLLKFVKINDSPITHQLVCNSDMNMVVIVPLSPVTLSDDQNRLTMNFGYVQHTDETDAVSQNAHHRYDRIREVVTTDKQTFDYTASFPRP